MFYLHYEKIYLFHAESNSYSFFPVFDTIVKRKRRLSDESPLTIYLLDKLEFVSLFPYQFF